MLNLKTADSTPEELIWARTLALEESLQVHGAPSAIDVDHDQRPEQTHTNLGPTKE